MLSWHEPLSLRRYINVENILYIIAELCLNLAWLARKRKELMDILASEERKTISKKGGNDVRTMKSI